jgi:hypothetical protein
MTRGTREQEIYEDRRYKRTGDILGQEIPDDSSSCTREQEESAGIQGRQEAENGKNL